MIESRVLVFGDRLPTDDAEHLVAEREKMLRELKAMLVEGVDQPVNPLGCFEIAGLDLASPFFADGNGILLALLKINALME